MTPIIILLIGLLCGWTLGSNYTDRRWVKMALKVFENRIKDDADWWKDKS